MNRFPFPGLPFRWTRGTTVTLTATVCLSLGGCLGLGDQPPATGPITDTRPMVAPKATPMSDEFNLKVAKPLPNPATPALLPLPALSAPPPPMKLEPLSVPEPVSLVTLPPIAAPATPPQISKPIPAPATPARDSVSGIEQSPTTVVTPTPAKPTPNPASGAPEARRSTASLPTGTGTASSVTMTAASR